MKQKLRMSSCALLMILMSACSCFGVTVPSKDGKTNLPLVQITDIIRHVTGKTSGDLVLEKDSLFLLRVNDRTSRPTLPYNATITIYNYYTVLNGYIYSFANNGGNTLSASYTNNGETYLVSPTIEGAAVVNPSTPTSRDKGKFLLNFVNENNSLKNEAVYVKHKDDSDNLNIDHHNVLNRIGQGNTGTGTNLIKVKAGINVKGYDGELVASLMRAARISLYIFQRSTSAKIHQPQPCSLLQVHRQGAPATAET